MFKKLEKTCRRKFSEVSFQFASWPLIGPSRHSGSKPVTVSAINFRIISRNAAPLDSIISTLFRKMPRKFIIFNHIIGRQSMTMFKQTQDSLSTRLSKPGTKSYCYHAYSCLFFDKFHKIIPKLSLTLPLIQTEDFILCMVRTVRYLLDSSSTVNESPSNDFYD